MFNYKTANRRAVLQGIAALAATSALPNAAMAQLKRLNIGATSTSSSAYGYYVALSNLLNGSDLGIDTTVVETGATRDNLRRMQRHQIDMGLVTTNIMYFASRGTGIYDGDKQSAMVGWLTSVAPQNVVVRKDSGVKSIYDLDGKSFNPGLKGSGTEKATEAVFELLGIKPKWVRGSTGEIADGVKDNRLIGYVKTGNGLLLDASTQEIAIVTPIRVLGLDEEAIKKIQAGRSDLSIVDIPGTESYNVDDYQTWGFAAGVALADNMSDDLAYEITKVVCEDKKVQIAAQKSLEGVDIAKFTMEYLTSPVHPGARRYYEELGLEVPEFKS